MSTIEDVRAAQEKMNDAKDALQRYVDRSPAHPMDQQLHRRLAEELKKTTDEYVNAVIALR